MIAVVEAVARPVSVPAFPRILTESVWYSVADFNTARSKKTLAGL
jgi:hypothetical protein